jgi:hypothetical protein
LTVEADGAIEVYSQPGEAEPGRYALFYNKKVDNFLKDAKDKGVNLSLVVFSSNEENISQLIADPVTNAKNLISEVGPIMKEYGFTDQFDIEMSRSLQIQREKILPHLSERSKRIWMKNP